MGNADGRATQKLVIFEPSPTGHRMVFVGWLLDELSAQDFRDVVVLTTGDALAHPIVKGLVERHGHWATFSTLPPVEAPRSLLRSIHPATEYQYRMFSALEAWLADHEGNVYVLVAYLEANMLIPLALTGRGPRGHAWGGILASTRCHYAKVGMNVPPRRLKDWGEGHLLSRLLNNRDADMVFTIDPHLRTVFPHKRLISIPDASPPFGKIENNLRHDLGIAPDDIVLLLYGHVDDRKALDLLCEALADPRVQQNVHLLVVGTQVQIARDILSRAPARELRAAGRLHEINRFVSESEEAAAFAAADIVWVYYPNNFWGSGVMVRGGRAGKPIISTAKGVIGHTVRHQEIGVAVTEENIEGVVAAVTALATDAALRTRLGAAGRNYYHDATPENFARPIVEGVRRHFEGSSHGGVLADRE